MLELGIDEATLVIKPKILPPTTNSLDSNIIIDWQTNAEYAILMFEDKANLIYALGERQIEQKAPNGYTIAYKYGYHNFYFAVGYHPDNPSMGVIVKFSAQALDYYCEVTGLCFFEFLQRIQTSEYSTRLSRIDLVADYVNEGVDVSQIYYDYNARKIGIFREYKSKKTNEILYKRCLLDYRGFAVSDEIPTIYFGSVHSKCELRVYNKKMEQINRKGTKYSQAVNCDNWIRFEGIFKQEYAHQLTTELLNINSKTEYANLIASALIQKFMFMKLDNGVMDVATDYTQMLIDCINYNSFILKSSSTKNYDLAKSIAYIFHGSGFITTLYKIKALWGNDARDKTMEKIVDFLDNWNPNENCEYWLLKNTNDYLHNYPSFDSFLDDVDVLLEKRGITN